MIILQKKRSCRRCNKVRIIQAKEMCNSCYKHYGTPQIICKECNELKNHKAKGLCRKCYMHHQIEYIKTLNAKRNHNILSKDYWDKTKECIICGFDAVVEIHHIDGNHKNSDINNLTGLCPNHHKMVHMLKYRNQIHQQIRERLGHG